VANTYDRGDTIRVTGTFVASGVGQFDPASVFMLLRNPLGSVATYAYSASVVKAATGAYYVDVVPSCLPPNGAWTYRWEGRPDSSAAAGEDSFIIRTTPFL
jgi:hypothetical protein